MMFEEAVRLEQLWCVGRLKLLDIENAQNKEYCEMAVSYMTEKILEL